MELDPQVRGLLEMVKAMGMPELHTLPVAEARQAMETLVQMRGPVEVVAKVEDRTIPGPAGGVAVRVYHPEPAETLPVLMWFHGGGWVLGNIETHDGNCRSLANQARCVVVSVDYRLAPEHRFPAAAEDCFAVTEWVSRHAAEIGGDGQRLAVGGDSAGGNLAAVVALMARDRGAPRLDFQLLVYPVTAADFDRGSYRENAEGYFLTRDSMRWFWDHYVPNPADRRNPYCAPLHADSLRHLPPALVITAGFDPLRDEGEAYAAQLQAAGVAARLSCYDGMIHGFFGMGALLAEGNRAVGEAAAALRQAWA